MPVPRFDPDPAAPYGRCLGCGVVVASEGDASTHLLAGAGAGGGHGVRVENPSRQRRIELEVDRLLDDALQGLFSRVDDLVARGDVTEAEASGAFSRHPDIAEAWEEYSQ